jgi:hypothetical protein
MTASELIAKVRSRLRDEAKEGWSDDELLDNLNMALSAMAHDLMLWKKRWETIASPGVDTYSIPEDFMAPISLLIGGVPIPIKGIEWALSNNSDQACGFIDFTSLILHPMPLGNENIILNYHALFQCYTLMDAVNIGIEHLDTAMFYTMSQSLQKEPSEDAITKSKYYLDLYKNRIASVSKITHQRRNASGSTTSHYQRV